MKISGTDLMKKAQAIVSNNVATPQQLGAVIYVLRNQKQMDWPEIQAFLTRHGYEHTVGTVKYYYYNRNRNGK